MNAPRPTMVWVYRYSGLGCAFAAGVMVFMAGGWLLDRVVGSFPVFMVLGALGGAALSTLSIYRRLETSRGPGEEPNEQGQG
ncbi:MAG: AtpZ/AtpI family protein [Gemmatimonadota bacterium]|nr:AtpZ/AtpI family protein [Gemmatimonadota bacterium]MDH3367172.1 AtpZ/AtpI family protein [Gemmatimonadota bacterium]MDH3478032.1 AtpZ/AtpI family protein [Gemmatimonadota bacterium]MDH3569431.1 AtpZ/AtpI family protein [Gemmatimonadota bacterium]MDH5549508.1 AtpZ/AtpI family protein [Gemmatimonadota bacterium]